MKKSHVRIATLNNFPSKKQTKKLNVMIKMNNIRRQENRIKKP